jgi:hypothetical protein
MALFEFLMIMISIVIGLALSEMLTGLGRLVRERDTVQFYWIHLLFQFGLFFGLLQQWWESWDLVDIGTIGFPSALLLLFPSIILYLIAHLLYPRTAPGADLQEYYFKQSPILWGLVVVGTLEGTFFQPVFENEPILSWTNISGFPMTAICVTLALTKRRWVHSILGPLVILLVIADTWLVNPTISDAAAG